MVEIVFFSVLNGVSYGLMLFMMASGLTLIFSLLGVLNFAHASMFMLGAYLSATVVGHTSFFVALVGATLLAGLFGAAVEMGGLRRLRSQGHVAEMLFTFGLVYLIQELVVMIWGRLPIEYPAPEWMGGFAFDVFGSVYPGSRVFMVFVSLLVLTSLIALLKWSRIGLIVRAALTHPRMVAALGHNVPAVFTLLFAAGSALAALAGAIGGLVLITAPNMADAIGPILWVVVIVGGLGSVGGAFVASLAIGLIQTFSVTLDISIADALRTFDIAQPDSVVLREVFGMKLSQAAPIIPYLVMVAVLLARPRGLMGTRDF